MDLSELIRSYTPEQKNVFSAFLIQLPLIIYYNVFIHTCF